MLTGTWARELSGEFKKPYYRRLYDFLKEAYGRDVVYPPAEDLLKAYELTPLEQVKVVILGQDPYHEPGQAQGLAFSVPPGVETPPSLVNIYKELQAELGCFIPDNGCLIPWARQGVLLLNTVLTVKAHRAGSHRGLGWEQFTDATISLLNRQERPLVFMLWGRPAGEKRNLLNNPAHLVLTASHPSPLSAYRGFFGCGHFNRCNEFLAARGEVPIQWQISNLS